MITSPQISSPFHRRAAIMRRPLRRALRALALTGALGLAGSGLAGCGHVPVRSMIALVRIDFATTDPKVLRIALRIPRTVRLDPDRQMLDVSATLKGLPEEKAQFRLAALNDSAELAALGPAPAGVATFAFRLAEGEAERFSSLRAALLARKKNGGGTIGIAIKPVVCRHGPLGEAPVRASVYLKTVETADFVPLVVDVDLKSQLGLEAEVEAIPPC